MATVLGDVTSYKRLYMQFRDSAAKTINITLNNPKNLTAIPQNRITSPETG